MIYEHRGEMSSLTFWHVAAALAESAALAVQLNCPEVIDYLKEVALDKLAEFSGAILFWSQQLGDERPVLELQTDFPRGAVFKSDHTSHGAVELELPGGVWSQLLDFSGQQTTPHTLLAAWACTLGKHSVQPDVVVGMPGAHDQETLAVRVNLEKLSFRSLTERTVQTIQSCLTHAGFNFKLIATEIQPNADPSRPAIFQTSLLYNYPDSFEHTEIDLIVTDHGSLEAPGLQVVFSKALFSETTARSIGRRFCVLLGKLLENPNAEMETLGLLDDAEYAEVVRAWNSTEQEYGGNTAYELLEAAAAVEPQKTALIFEGSKMNYSTLMQSTGQLAMHLRGLGAGHDQVVGLVVEKSTEEVCGMVGVIRSGAAYMPLDPKQPADRLSYLCEVTEADLVVSMAKFAGLSNGFSKNVVVAEEVLYNHELQQIYTPDPNCSRKSMAYALFTSGSTGKPKGLMVEHGCLVCYLQHHTPLGYGSDETFRNHVSLFLVSFTFDVSVASVWQPLTKGATLVIGKPGAWVEPHYIEALIAEHSVSHMWAVPSPFSLTLQAMKGKIPASLVELHLIGEALPTPMAEVILTNPHVTLYNEYGPAEVTIASHSYHVGNKDLAACSIPIGSSLPNTTSFILDPMRLPVPVGVPGELYLGGPKVSRGYVGRPDLTAEAFLSIPELAETTIYKTGDRVAWLAGGEIRFLGRVDFQVKLNGQRIETGEIEQVIRSAENVKDALVMVAETNGGSKQLVAYVIPEDANVVISTDGVLECCRSALPGYMVPAQVIRLVEWPLNQNQKVDRKAVVKLGEEQLDLSGPSTYGNKEPPANPTEQMLVDVWGRVLGVEGIGVTDNFFSLGGSSITAVRMIGEVETACGKLLELNDVFQQPTIRQVAALLDPSQEGGEGKSKFAPFLHVNAGCGANEALKLFMCPPAGGLAFPYFNFGAALGGEVSLHAFQDPALDKHVPFAETVEELASTFIKALKSVQPHGPYMLGGWSFGASVALEMAQQLTAAGEEVPVVYMLDGYAPRVDQDFEAVKKQFDALVRSDTKGWAEGCYMKGGFLKTLAKPFVSKELRERVESQGDQKLVAGFSRMMAILDQHLKLETSYQPKQYNGRVVNFRPTGDQSWSAALVDDKLWSEQVGGLFNGQVVSGYQIVEVQGDHQTMMRWPCCQLLADRCKSVLGLASETPQLVKPNIFDGKGCLHVGPVCAGDIIHEVAAVITEVPSTDRAWKRAGIRTLGGWRELDNSALLTIDVSVTFKDPEQPQRDFSVKRSFLDLCILHEYMNTLGGSKTMSMPQPVVRTRTYNPTKLRQRIQQLNQLLETLVVTHLAMPEVWSFCCLNRVQL